MPKINEIQAKQFLEKINPKDKVAIIHHDDLDGFASGIIFQEWCEQKNAKTENFIFIYNTPEIFNLKKFNKVIITDVAPSGVIIFQQQLKNKEVFYTDHHPAREEIPTEMLELRTTNEGYIPSSRTALELTNIKPWLALAGTISDAADLYPENKEFISSLLKKEKLSLKKFKEQTHKISNMMIYFNKELQKAYNILKKINTIHNLKEIENYSQKIEKELLKYEKKYQNNKEKIGKANFFYLNPKYSIKRILINKFSRKYPGRILIFASKKQEKITMSARSQQDNIDLPKMFEEVLANIKGSSSGGHKRATGASIPGKSLKQFKENLRQYFKK